MSYKYTCLCLILLGISINIYSQHREIYLHTCHYQDYHYTDTDTSRIWHTNTIPNLIIITMNKSNNEYFVITDTLYRDYIMLDEKKYLIDSLCMKNHNEYAMAFEYNGTYLIACKNSKYLIITGSNNFQYGTLIQPLYMIFQKKETENKYQFLSSYYIENIDYYSEKILNSVRVIKKRDKIILKGINLKCIHFK